MMLNLRIRGPKDTATIAIAPEKTIGELKELIESKLTLDDSKEYEILAGFPPKGLQLEDDVILQGHLNNNDSLRVQYTELSGQQKVKIPKTKKVQSPAKPPPPPAPAMIPFSGRTASLNPPPKPVNKNKGTRKSSSGGRAAAAASTRRLSAADTASSEADISEHLIQAVNGGTGKRNKVLRKVFRDAVEHQYNSAKAVSRLQAVYSGKYTIKEDLQSRILNSGQSSRIHVNFHRGVGSRTYFTETVDLLSAEMLVELMKLALQDTEGNGRDVLKPMNLSKCSPRIFWSLVHHHGPNLIDSIKHLLEGVDSCEWLTERKRELSEKAKENVRQKELEDEVKQAKKRRKLSNKKGGEGAEVTVDLSRENSFVSEEFGKLTVAQSLSPVSARLLQFLSKIPCSGLFPAPYEAFLFQYFTNSTSTSSSSSAEPSNSPLLSLANYSANHLADLNKAFQVYVSNNTSTTLKSSAVLYEDQVESWIQIAQRTVLFIFWNQICGGGSERLYQAFKKLRIRTPSELIVWKEAPDGLLQGLVEIDPALTKIEYYWHPILQFPPAESTDQATLTLDIVKALIQYSLEIESLLVWIKGTESIIIDELRFEEAEEEEEESANWEEDWQFEASSHKFIGERCRVIVRSDLEAQPADEDSQGKEEEDEQASEKKVYESMEAVLFSGSYWEDGRCVAYLPATEEEPMALWRIQIEANPKKGLQSTANSSSSSNTKFPKEGRFEDMEELEIIHAKKLITMK